MNQLQRVIAFVIAFVSIAVASYWLFIAIMLYMTAISTPLLEDSAVPANILTFSTLTVLTVTVTFIDFRAPSKSRSDIECFRRRSRRCRKLSWAMLLVIVGVAFLGFTAAAGSDGTEQPPYGGVGRFASFVLLVILMRILASVYRYNLHLASFYDARADYLCLAKSMRALSHKELLDLVGTDELSTTSIRGLLYSLLGRSPFQDEPRMRRVEVIRR